MNSISRINALLFSALFTMAIVTQGCGKEKEELPPQKRTVRVAHAREVEPGHALRFPGLASASREVNLSFRVGGNLQQRLADVGREVAFGELLALLDEGDLRLAVARAEGERLRAEAGLKRARADFLRLLRVAEGDPRATSKQSLDAAREAEESAAADLVAAQASLALAENQRSYAALRAPFAGRVVAVFAEEHQEVAAREPILRLLDTSEVEMVIHISERMMPLLAAEGAKLSVTYDLYPGRPLEAIVKKVGTEAEAVTRTYPITLRMSPPPGMVVWAGMVGQATLHRSPAMQLPGAIVPLSAILSKEEGRGCSWVVEGDPPRATYRPITIFSLRDDGVVVEGISPGEVVVTAGAHFLSEGVPLHLIGRQL